MPGAGCRAAANEIKDTAITPEKICTVSQERSCTPQELPDAYEKKPEGPPGFGSSVPHIPSFSMHKYE